MTKGFSSSRIKDQIFSDQTMPVKVEKVSAKQRGEVDKKLTFTCKTGNGLKINSS
jgi:hypothetical protein